MRVDTDELVHQGTQRYEDAMDIWAVYKMIGDVGAIPDQAWGKLRWSDEWRRSWVRAIEWRRKDAVAAGNVMFQTSYALLQIAADYSGTDIEAATSFDNLDEDVRGYHSRGPGDYRLPPFSPGGNPTPPQIGDPTATHRRPDVLKNESTKPPLWVDEHGPYTGWNPRAEDDTLNEFMADNGETLREIAKVYLADSGKEWEALTIKLDPAHSTFPTVIHNRADLIHSCASMYDSIYERVKRDYGRVADSWTNSAGGWAFLEHLKMLQDYISKCGNLCTKLASEGTDIAKVIKSIRSAYASAGYDHIDNLIANWEDYEDTITSYVGGVIEAFTNGATEQLMAAADRFTDAMTAKASSEHKWADSLIVAEERAGDAPDLDSKNRKHKPFPAEDPYSGWDSPGEWRSER